MNLRLDILIIALIVNMLLAFFVYKNNPKSKTNIIFGLLSIVTSLWLLDIYLSVGRLSSFWALSLVRLSLLLAAPQIMLFFLLTHTLPQKELQLQVRRLYILLTIMVLVMIDAMSPLAFTGVKMTNNAPQTIPGPGIALFGIYAVSLSVASVINLIIRIRRSKAAMRGQYQYVLAGVALMLGLLVATVLIPAVVFRNSRFVVLTPVYTMIFLGFTTYAIVRKHLFDMRAVVARSVAFVLLLGSLGGIFSLGLFAASTLFLANNSSKFLELAVNTTLALILVFTFQPMRRFFERITDKLFFRDRYDSQQLLNQITQTLASEIDLGTILDKTLTMIAQAVRVNFGQYMIFEDGKVYKVEHYGKMPEELITTTELKALNRSMLVADELEAGERKDVMDKHNIRLSLVLRTKDEFVGFLLLGDKLSGDIYSTQDIELFEILANELAVAIVNAKAYEEIAQFNITLQDKVNQATARLRTANKHLKDLDQAKDEFISMASHQLRTPLTTIKGYISMLQEGDAGKVTKEQNEFLNYAYDGSERMVGLISDLLNVSRMNSGKFMIDRTDVDPVAMVGDEVRQLMSHADAKKLKLIWNAPKEKIPHVQLDENKTRQVIMNFIDNAIYYTREGSVTVSLAQKGDNIELRVTDTGIGVPKDAQDKLFGKFFRAGNAQQIRPDGTGLGLYLAKRVVEDQGGSTIFESTEGKGSTFGFLLPIKAPMSEKAPAVPAAAKAQSANPSALAAKAKAASKVAVGA